MDSESLVQENDVFGVAYTVMQVCDSSVDPNIYMLPGDGKNANKNLKAGPEVFTQQGIPCDRRVWANGTMVIIFCDMYLLCESSEKVIGLVGQNKTDGGMFFLNETAYPIATEFISDYDWMRGSKCRNTSLVYIIVGIIFGVLFIIGITVVIRLKMTQRRRRRRAEQGTSGHNPSNIRGSVPTTPPASDDEESQAEQEEDENHGQDGEGGNGRDDRKNGTIEVTGRFID